MNVTSKYMVDFICKEEDRIRREIVTNVYKAFKDKGYRISISHDSQNETEKTVHSVKACLKQVFEFEYTTDRCWLFAHGHSGHVAYWVMFVIDNVQDIVSDYSINAEAILKPICENTQKYD